MDDIMKINYAKTFLIILFLLVVIISLCSCSSQAEKDVLQSQIDELQSQIYNLEKENYELTSFIDHACHYAESMVWDLYYPDDLINDFGGYADGIQDFVNYRYRQNYDDFKALVKALRDMNDQVN